MRNVHGLMELAYRLAHEVSDAALELEADREARAPRIYLRRLADSGVSVLAQVAAAAADSKASDYRSRVDCTVALRGARAELNILRQALDALARYDGVSTELVAELRSTADQLVAVLLALTVELRGRLVA